MPNEKLKARSPSLREADLRQAMLASSRAILAKQLRTDRELRDTRERLREQNNELSSTQAMLSAVLDVTPLGVMACNLEGRVQRTNRRLDEMFANRGDSPTGQASDRVAAVLGELLPANHDLQPWIATVLADPGRTHAVDVTTADGRLLQCRAVPQRDGDACLGVVLNWLDITEQIHAVGLRTETAASQRANAAKSAFMSRASHELRTPLNAVCGFSQLLGMNPLIQSDPATLQQAGLILAAGQHLTALVDDLMQLSRMESGELPLRDEAVELAPCAQEVMALVALSAQQRQIRLQLDLPDLPNLPDQAETAVVRGDRTRVRQVLLNLVSNGIKYNRPGGSVQVAVRSVDAGWATDVIDTGVGLAPDQLAHLYEPFNRLGAERKQIEGTGLGLTISRHLALAMNGKLDVESTVGVGSRFTVTLPANAPLP